MLIDTRTDDVAVIADIINHLHRATRYPEEARWVEVHWLLRTPVRRIEPYITRIRQHAIEDTKRLKCLITL